MTDHSDNLYEKTRQSWETIWQEANVQAELEVLKQPRTRAQFDVFPRFLSREGIILEAGSGLGATLIYLRDLGFNVIGLDYAENALRACRSYDPTLTLHAGDVHALPYRDETLHGYLSFGVLEHFEHGLAPALREANRVLVPGGIVVLTIPYPNLVHKLIAWKRSLQGHSRLTDDDFYESTYTRRQLERDLEAAGFEVLLARPTSHSFTLWGLGGPFRAEGYYKTTWLAEKLGDLLRRILPWPFNFTTMMIARKVRRLGGA